MASIEAYTGRQELSSLSVGWTISKLKEKMNTTKPGEYIQLTNLKVGETKWKFHFYANGEAEKSKGNLSIFCFSENQTAKLARVSIKLKDRNIPGEHTFTNNFTPVSMNRGYDKFISHSDINANEKNYLSNGDLELAIKILVYEDEKTTIKTEVSPNLDLDSIKLIEKSNLCADWKECWMDDEFSDVKIKCGGAIFNCHRIVLVRRSNYFRTMLKGNFKESQSGVIDMENMDAETFKAVLKYIYEGELESLETNAVALLEASERFELANLKTICEEFLIAYYVKVENVIDTLLMADLYKAKKLRKCAMDMIASNWDKVTKQGGWKEKLGRSNHLILEILEAIGTQK